MITIKLPLAVVLLAATVASATTYDAVTDFSPTPTVWSYGTGVNGSSFTPYPDFHAVCEGDARVSCYQTTTPVSRVPFVAKNILGGTIDTYDTVVFPSNVLNVHPGPSTDSIVRFTAPTTGSYRISGFFELLDINPSGVIVSIYTAGNFDGSATLTGPAAVFPDMVGGAAAFGGVRFLTAGQTVDFGVNNDGSFFNDSTGLSATLTTVPEPATWLLMIAGFGLVGAGLRRRNLAAA